MKHLNDFISESVNIKPTFSLKHDVYNVLSDLAFEYEKKNKKFNKDEFEDAVENFMNKFFEEINDDEDDDD